MFFLPHSARACSIAVLQMQSVVCAHAVGAPEMYVCDLYVSMCLLSQFWIQRQNVGVQFLA